MKNSVTRRVRAWSVCRIRGGCSSPPHGPRFLVGLSARGPRGVTPTSGRDLLELKTRGPRRSKRYSRAGRPRHSNARFNFRSREGSPSFKCIRMPMVETNGHAKLVGKRPSENDVIQNNVKQHTGNNS